MKNIHERNCRQRIRQKINQNSNSNSRPSEKIEFIKQTTISKKVMHPIVGDIQSAVGKSYGNSR